MPPVAQTPVNASPAQGRRSLPLFAQILIGMVLGAAVGIVFGPATAPLGRFGSLLIQVIKALAAPLLFLAIVDAFLTTEMRARDGLRMVGISATNATIAVTIGLTLSNLLRPGDHVHVPPVLQTPEIGKGLDFADTLTGYIPSNLLQPFLQGDLIPIVLIAVMLGLALRSVKRSQLATGEQGHVSVESFVRTSYQAVQVAIGWVIRTVPVAVFAVVAKTVGEHGFAPVRGLMIYVLVALLGIFAQVVIVYQGWIVLFTRLSLREFWSGARDAVVYALGASSSLATLPITLRSLDRLRVSRESSTLAACVGTNLNNDSILLYEAMAALFVAQVYGIDLTLTQQLLVAGSCVLAGIGIAGIPDAGLISLSLVLGTVGLPIEILPLLLTVDWILSRFRAASNVVSDILVAILLDRFKERPSEA